MSKYTNLKILIIFISIFIAILTFITSPPNNLSKDGWRIAGLASIMALFWIFEVIPIYATSLFPLVYCPLMNIATFQEAASPYSNQIIYLFLGGFFLAIGLENTGLHKRFALKVLYILGKSPSTVLIGFLVSASIISSIVNNTSTTLMMLPIALSVVREVINRKVLSSEEDKNNFSISILLSIAYGSSIGGITTLIGTAPNIYMAGFINSTLGYNISFFRWLYIGIPICIFGILTIYITLDKIIFKIKQIDKFDNRKYFNDEYNKLGFWKKEEKIILFIFILAVCLWLFQPIINKIHKNINDGVIAIFCSILLFIVPINFRDNIYILDKSSISKIPWESMLLFGGGFSLAYMIEKTKLADWLGNIFGFIGLMPIIIQIFLIVTLIIFITELTSNIATTAVFLPILSALAQVNNINPLILIIPATIAASCAFMLPVSTPPNAIVYASGTIKISQMAKAGLFLNLFFIILITLIMYFIGIHIFDL